jgi:hypothetical protein
MTRIVLALLLVLPSVLFAGSPKKDCVADGGVWSGGGCLYPDYSNYPDEYDECTPATQFIDCPGGSTSATGPGICVLGETGYYECGYLYQQSCKNDNDCADALGVESSAYVCCQSGSTSRCLNPYLCR